MPELLPPRVLVVGAGGLGSPVALGLLGLPALTLAIVDDDRVELSNLHRQLLHGEADLGRWKVESARDALRRRAPGWDIVPIAARLTAANADTLLRGYPIVVDGSDSIETKFAVSDAAVRLGAAAVIGGVVRFCGQVLTVLPGATCCYRCVFEEPPPPGTVVSCQEAGVLGPACGVVGGVMAGEVLRLLRGERPAYAGALLVADLLRDRWRRVPWPRRAGCPACML